MRIEIERERDRFPIYRTFTEDDEKIDSSEKIYNKLKDIADNLGYDYMEESQTGLGKGIISVRNDVNIYISYDDSIKSLNVGIKTINGKQSMFNCTRNSSSIEDISVALQTASMICAEIRKKVM